MKKTHHTPRTLTSGLAILFTASLLGSPAMAANYYHLGDVARRIDQASSYSNTDGGKVLASIAPREGDDLFFYNSTVTGPANLTLQTGPYPLTFHSLTFLKNAGDTQIDRGPKSTGDATVIQIGKGGITLESGSGAVNIGTPADSENQQRIVIGAVADFSITNNSSGDLTFHRVFDGRSDETSHTITVTGSGSGNVTFVEGVRSTKSNARDLAMIINTSGTGVVRFDGKNTYMGPTTVAAGKLFINGDSNAADGALSVSARATLGGSGRSGASVTIANEGCLEFDISKPNKKHESLGLSSSSKLTFSGGSVLTITSSGGASAGKYKLITAPGGISGSAPATVKLPDGWAGKVSIEGNALVLDLTSVGTP